MEFRFKFIFEGQDIPIDEPVGWTDDARFVLKRDFKHYGAVFEYSTELSFVRQARQFLLDTYRQYNIDAVVLLYVEYYHPSLFEWRFFYEGVLVLKDLQVNRLYAKCRVEQVDFSRVFRNRRDIDVQLTTSKTVRLHSNTLVRTAKWEFDANFDRYLREDNRVTETKTNAYLLPLRNSTNELDFANNNISSYWANNIFNVNSDEGNDAAEVPEHSVSFAYSGEVTLTWDLNGQVEMFTDSGSCNYRITLSYLCAREYNAGSPPNTFLYAVPTAPGFLPLTAGLVKTEVIDTSGSVTFYAEAGQRLWFHLRVAHNEGAADSPIIQNGILMNSGSFFQVVQETVAPASDCQGVMVLDALNKIVEDYTGQASRVRSDFFSTGGGRNCFITNGFRLRGEIDKQFVLSFDKLYVGLRQMFNLGFAIRKEGGIDVLRVEPMRYWFDSGASPVLTISNPADKTISPYQDLFFNKILVGYKEWSDENLNGLFEFNADRQYSLQVKMGQYQDVEKNRIELDIRTEFIASGYLIEQMRRFVGKNTTDNEFDNSLFVIALNPVSAVSQKYGNNDAYLPLTASELAVDDFGNGDFGLGGEGVLGSEYNVRYAPVYSLVYWLSYIQAQLVKNFSNLGKIQFRSGSGKTNVNIIAIDAVIEMPYEYVVYEGQDILPTSGLVNPNTSPNWIGGAILDAELLELECPIGFDTFQRLRGNPYGVVRVDGADYYILEVDFQPYKGLANFKLIKKYTNV